MRRAGGIIVIALLIAGCAHRDKLVLFPNEGNADTGAVAVLDPVTGEDVSEIGTANTRAKVAGRSVSKAVKSPKSLDKSYGALLGGLPRKPRDFTFYFEFDGVNLTPESRAQLPALFAEIDRRKSEGVDIDVVGHADKMGPGGMNDKLSSDRADAMVRILVQENIPMDLIHPSSRGEREPAFVTKDGVSDSRNRRVVVTVK